MTDLNKEILALAEQWEGMEAAQGKLNDTRRELAGEIAALVKKHGASPPRATRLRVLRAEDGTELRVTTGQELRVDGSLARRVRRVLREAKDSWAFRYIFRRVDSYVLTEGAHEFIASLQGRVPGSVLRRVRELFLAAIEERDKSPEIEIRRAQRKESAA